MSIRKRVWQNRKGAQEAWIVDYMDAWLERMQKNGGVIPSYVDYRDGKIGGPEGKWWNNAYGWGFSPVNPVKGKREDRNRIPRAVVGFQNAVMVTGNQKYADAWRAMMDAVNSHARTVDGKKQYPTMCGAEGWYGWQPRPWNVGAMELWYLSMRDADRARVEGNAEGREPANEEERARGDARGWVTYLQGKNASYPETALRRDLATMKRRTEQFRADKTTWDQRLADNMLSWNPAAIDARPPSAG